MLSRFNPEGSKDPRVTIWSQLPRTAGAGFEQWDGEEAYFQRLRGMGGTVKRSSSGTRWGPQQTRVEIELVRPTIANRARYAWISFPIFAILLAYFGSSAQTPESPLSRTATPRFASGRGRTASASAIKAF